MSRPVLIISLLICFFVAIPVVIGYRQAAENRSAAQASGNKALAPLEEERLLGAEDARIVAVEYFDLECPFCKQLHGDLPHFLSQFEGKSVAFAYRHYPLEQIHLQALTEAVALECVGMLKGNDAFFEFQDMVYDHSEGDDTLDLERLPEFARTLGISDEAFAACRSGDEAKRRVTEQKQRGVLIGVDRTPSVALYKDGVLQYLVDAGSPLGRRSLEASIETLLKDTVSENNDHAPSQ